MDEDYAPRIHDEAGSPRRGHPIAALLIVAMLAGGAGLLFPAHVHSRLATTTAPTRIPAPALVARPVIVTGPQASATPPTTGHIVWIYYHNKWRPVPR